MPCECLCDEKQWYVFWSELKFDSAQFIFRKNAHYFACHSPFQQALIFTTYLSNITKYRFRICRSCLSWYVPFSVSSYLFMIISLFFILVLIWCRIYVCIPTRSPTLIWYIFLYLCQLITFHPSIYHQFIFKTPLLVYHNVCCHHQIRIILSDS